jgi:hypothetical protein
MKLPLKEPLFALMNPLILNEHKNSFDLINIVQNNDKKLLNATHNKSNIFPESPKIS